MWMIQSQFPNPSLRRLHTHTDNTNIKNIQKQTHHPSFVFYLWVSETVRHQFQLALPIVSLPVTSISDICTQSEVRWKSMSLSKIWELAILGWPGFWDTRRPRSLSPWNTSSVALRFNCSSLYYWMLKKSVMVFMFQYMVLVLCFTNDERFNIFSWNSSFLGLVWSPRKCKKGKDRFGPFLNLE